MKKEEAKKKEVKIVRGWNLSQENVMWLTRMAFAATLKRVKGTTSASEVLDEIVTAARKKMGEPEVRL